MKKILQAVGLLLFFSSITSISFAQNGEYDVRFNLHDVDFTLQKLYADIEIKASADTSRFNIAEQNYRLSFNRNALANPSIDQELDISGFVSVGGTTSFYSAHTLTGSIDTVISYNIELSGGDGYPVTDTAWVGVGRLVFDIVDTNACALLEWHDNNKFPPTFIAEKLPNTFLKAVPGKGYMNLDICFPDIGCMDGPVTASDDNAQTTDDTPITICVLDNDNQNAPPNTCRLDPGSIFITNNIPLSQGSLAVNYNTGCIDFIPSGNYSGLVTFTYRVCNISATHCANATVNINVLSLAACRRDSYEPNNTLATSADMYSNTGSLAFGTPRICPSGDVDCIHLKQLLSKDVLIFVYSDCQLIIILNYMVKMEI